MLRWEPAAERQPFGHLLHIVPSTSYQHEAKYMDWLDKVLEKLRQWVEQAMDALLGPVPQEEPIPIPINDSRSRGGRY